MARKKKVAPIVEETPTPVVETPVPAPEVEKRLTREEMLELRALEAEGKLAALGIQQNVALREAYLKEIDPQGKLNSISNLIRTLSESSTHTAREQARLKGEIEKRLGIDNLAKYTYDDFSGDLKLPD